MADPSDPSQPAAGEAWRSPVRTFDSRATYVIRVEGQLSSDWSPRLGGLRIATHAASGVRVTELTGELRDQAALLGVLTELYELGLPLLAVVRMPEADRDALGPARAAARALDATRRTGSGRRRRPSAERSPARRARTPVPAPPCPPD